MAVTNYYSIHGQIVGEKTTGSSRVDYLTDALGSVTGTVDQSANVVNTYRYKPFGGLLAKTGAGSDPAFQWVGSQGYRNTGKAFSDVYIRRRHCSSGTGRWTTPSPLGNSVGLNRYVYAANSPAQRTDLPASPTPGQGILLTIVPVLSQRLHPPKKWCGATEFLARWEVAINGPEIGDARPYGFVVQKVEYTGEKVDCRTGKTTPLHFDPDVYWERWEVNVKDDVITVDPRRRRSWGKGQNRKSELYNDRFRVPGQLDRTKGKHHLRGYAIFTDHFPEADWKQGTDNGPWGLLWYSRTAPKNLTFGATPNHELFVVWNCCDPDDKNAPNPVYMTNKVDPKPFIETIDE